MIVLAATSFASAVTVAGWMRNVWLVLLFLTIAGGCDMVSVIFRSTMLNQTIPDELRGRLAGIEVLSFSAGPQSGQLRAGGMAALTSVRTSVWSGGLMCLAAVGLLAAAVPKLMSYDARTDEHAVRMRTRTRKTAEGEALA
jgi:MFS family permease